MSTALAADKPVALIIAQGGLGDQSYNDLAYAGFKKAIAAAKLEGKPVESKDVVAQAADILRRASDAGFGLVVDLEYSHGDALASVAKDYAGTDYVILNQVKPGANVASVLFQEQEGSYLAGALATLVAKDSSIKKCEAAAKPAAPASDCESKAVSKAGKPLAGAAKTSFMKKCEADAAKK